jgi:3-hydroxybutyryl-CoA dehydrogenase
VTVGRVGVAGAGTMGAGIAQLGCLGGFETFLFDPDAEALERGCERVRANLARGSERGWWTAADAESAAGRLLPASRLEDLGGCELVVEAAPEDLEVKRDLVARLEAACAPDAVLATNTSSLSVTTIAASAQRPERICGMHFFNPPALMKLVEVVAGEATGEAALAVTAAVAERMGRTPVRAADGIGFLANRGARPFTLEALRLHGERVAEPDQIDRIVRIGGGYRMGPFELMDLIGIDVNLEVARSFYEQSFGEPRWRPHPLQERMVSSGRLGRKSGHGWYEYGDGPYRPDDPQPLERRASASATGRSKPRCAGSRSRTSSAHGWSRSQLRPAAGAMTWAPRGATSRRWASTSRARQATRRDLSSDGSSASWSTRPALRSARESAAPKTSIRR